MRRTVIAGAALACFLLAASPALADTHTVPGMHATIQAAISSATAGDVVQVSAGTYTENIRMDQKPITVRGAGASTTTIRGTGSDAPTVKIEWSLDCTLTGFTITNGRRGGVFVTMNPCRPVITGNIITGNSVTSFVGETPVYGGGGVTSWDASPLVTGNTITKNTGTAGGGVYAFADNPAYPGWSPAISNNVITENTSTAGGGGIMCSANATMTGNTITNNVATGSDGGGIYFTNGCTPPVERNTISRNRAFNGAGIYIAGATPRIVNALITGNTALGSGGGLFVYDSVTLLNCTIAGNRGLAGMVASGATPSIKNCIFWDNGGDDLWACSATYSDISSQDDTPGAGNISSNPLFVDAAAGNYRLRMRSPAIDAGTNAGAPAIDLEDTSRPRDGNNDAVATTDMGAYEATCTGTTTIYVSPAGNDTTGNGTSSAPFRSITRGLALALPGDTVRVGAGPFGKNFSNETFPIWMKDGVTLQGNGTDDRNASTVTTIFGNGTQRIFVLRGMTRPTKIDGFCMTGGKDIYGGAIYVDQSSQTTISNNAITYCTAQTSDPYQLPGGGAIHLSYGADVTLSGNMIRNNTAVNGSGGGVWIEARATARLYNNVIAFNSSTGSSEFFWPGHGGGIFMCQDASATITNNVIHQNSATSTLYPAGPGGGLFVADRFTSHRITNNIFWNNTDDIGCSDNTTVTTSYCDVKDGDAGTGNISSAPAFVAPEGSDWRLSPRSACIDAGTNTGAPATDRDGATRPRDGDGNGTATADMGAYEAAAYSGPVTIQVWNGGHDFDGNGTELDPYQSITKGMSVALRGDTIWCAPRAPFTSAIYTTTNRERFPIQMKSGVKLIGSGASANEIRGDGAHSVIRAVGVDASTTIEGFTIRMGGGQSGAGVYCESGAALAISRNVIADNSAGDEGGGIYCWDASPKIVRNTIRNNSAPYGAGIWVAGGGPSIVNNFISGNTASEQGAGAYSFVGGYPGLVNNTIAGNSAPVGSGVACFSAGGATIRNSILWNTGTSELANCSATYSDIRGGSAGTGNISAAPSFVNTSTGDYHLADGSPCVDAGTNTGAPADDIDGQARPWDGNYDGTNVVDMGADEQFIVRNTALTFSTSTALASYDTTITYSGRLRMLPGGGPVTWKRVAVQAKQYGETSYKTIKYMLTDDAGRFSGAVKPSRQTVYRAAFSSTTGFRYCTSPLVTVKVKASVTIGIKPATVPAGGTVSFEGAVAPAHSGQTMTIYRKVSGVWKAFKTTTLKSNSQYAVKVTFPAACTYYYRVGFPGDADHVSNVSTYKLLTVTPATR